MLNKFDLFRSQVFQTDYFAQRGISDQTIKSCGNVGFSQNVPWPGGNKDQPAVVFKTGGDSMVFRAIREVEPRYKNEGKAGLFNAEVIEKDEITFIVEGAIDALSVMELGGQAVGLNSTANLNLLLSILKRCKKRINPFILSLDTDEKGKEAQRNLADELEKIGIPYCEFPVQGESFKDANERLLNDREGLAKAIVAAIELAKPRITALDHMPELLKAIERNRQTGSISTGFKLIDDLLDGGLRPGLYIIGAIAALGKSAVVGQIADKIAKNGFQVMLILLEMRPHEVMCRSISREAFRSYAKNHEGYIEGRGFPNCSKELKNIDYMKSLKGRIAENVPRAKQIEWPSGPLNQKHVKWLELGLGEYKKYAGNIIISSKSRTLAQIIHDVDVHRPNVVLIDYLQLIDVCRDRISERQAIDRAVQELKDLSTKLNIPIILVSSLNRASYEDQVSMTSFKESGGIEHTADVLIGMQLSFLRENPKPNASMTVKVGEGKKNKSALREWQKALRASMELPHRVIDWVLLKSRNGALGGVKLSNRPAYFHFDELEVISQKIETSVLTEEDDDDEEERVSL